MVEESPTAPPAVVAFAPGRLTLIGDHTDYTGGYAMALALDLGTEVAFAPGAAGEAVTFTSAAVPERVRVPLTQSADEIDVAMVLPEWGRYVAALVGLLKPTHGGSGTITSSLPLGAGLSSSAALGVALALALGAEDEPVALARLCQRAEHLAAGVATGVLDQLAIASATTGRAMFIDCLSLEVAQVVIPEEAEFVAVHCGVPRQVASSSYGERRRQCAQAEAEIGPLRSARAWDLDALKDPLVRRRARHVLSENARVVAFRGALEHGDLRQAGELMNDSHRSLASDFEVSLPALDQLVGFLQGCEGVYGARLTGAGFGGCAVALCRPGALEAVLRGRRHWAARPGRGARRL